MLRSHDDDSAEIVSARINFGAENEDPVRYPDNPFDRIWQSDLVKKANYLVDVAAGTERVSTESPIDTGKDEQPPQKVMQTAVVGRNGTLTCRMNLDGFPGFGWAYTYFAEIEDLAPTKTRKFRSCGCEFNIGLQLSDWAQEGGESMFTRCMVMVACWEIALTATIDAYKPKTYIKFRFSVVVGRIFSITHGGSSKSKHIQDRSTFSPASSLISSATILLLK
ncbi:hypothetical protein L1887_17572 [Cichorium endivia]|nr:hypothetical protein L1887_17572 [Cichorium endivia]